jgi:hypothetical protein
MAMKFQLGSVIDKGRTGSPAPEPMSIQVLPVSNARASETRSGAKQSRMCRSHSSFRSESLIRFWDLDALFRKASNERSFGRASIGGWGVGSSCFTWNQTLVKESEVPVRVGPNQREEKRIQRAVPVQDCFTGIAKQFQPIGTRRLGCEVAHPKIWSRRRVPAARKGRDPGGAAEPSSRFALGGGALIGQECNQPSMSQGSVSHLVAGFIIEDRRLVKVPYIGNHMLPQWMMSGPGNSDGIRTEDMENPCQPFPISMMHGKE